MFILSFAHIKLIQEIFELHRCRFNEYETLYRTFLAVKLVVLFSFPSTTVHDISYPLSYTHNLISALCSLLKRVDARPLRLLAPVTGTL